jgi:hypothetical protein
MITPTRAGSKARSSADPMMWVTANKWATSAGVASTQWSTSSIGTTSVWPCASGLIDRNATHCSSRHTNVPGSSWLMMRVKIVAMAAL